MAPARFSRDACMGTPGVTGLLLLLASAAGGAILLWGAYSRHRTAQHQISAARAETDRLLKQAQREAETLRKEAELEARERAHAAMAAADQRARERQLEINALEQALADKTRTLADRLATTDRLDQELRARDRQIGIREEAVTAAVKRAEQLVTDRQRELQRVAGLTADEARELLLKQIEAEARREAANTVKRLDAEA